MKLVVAGLRGIPGVMGGVESHCEELLPRIKSLRPNWAILVIGRSGYLPSKRITFRGISIRALPAPRRPGVETIISTFLAVLYGRWRGADIMCLHGIGPGLISGLARLLGMRVVVTYHSRNYDHAKWSRIGRLALRLGERTTFRFADKVIVVAAWLEQELALSYAMHRGKLVHIPNGVSELGAEPCYPPSGELEAGFVLAVGRLVPEKGFDYLIRAAQAANVRLVIAGAADHDSAHARDLLASAGDRITFLGRQPRERLRWLYENARLFVLPSFHEGMPLAALEAISCGTPVLLSDIPANRDLALPPDRYFSTGREDILAERLTEAHPSSFRFAQTLRKSFDWDEIAAQTVETLEQVARGD